MLNNKLDKKSFKTGLNKFHVRNDRQNTFSSYPKLGTYMTDKKLIAVVARLCLSSHYLAIERRRYTRPKTPVANRICQANQVDDEIHFLMQCNLFKLDGKALLAEAEKYITNLTPYLKLND